MVNVCKKNIVHVLWHIRLRSYAVLCELLWLMFVKKNIVHRQGAKDIKCAQHLNLFSFAAFHNKSS